MAYDPEYHRAWRANNKEKLQAYYRERHLADRDRLNAKTRAWHAANKVHRCAYAAANREHIRERDRLWREKNPARYSTYLAAYYDGNAERLRAYASAWLKANRDKGNYYGAKRRAAQIKATPLWANMEAIREFYEMAAAASAHTGVQYHVDHIVPLQGKTVCGLHVANNLDVIPATENIKKNRHRWPDMFERQRP